MDILTRQLSILLLLLTPGLCAALPAESRVPGGIALIDLGATPRAPQAWLEEQPVWVAKQGGRWIAVVGIGLDTPPGAQELRVSDGPSERRIRFDVAAKAYPEQRITLKDNGKVTLSPENEARAVQEIARIQQLKRHWQASEEALSDFRRPTEGRQVSNFGLRRVFNGQPRAPHSGLDIAVPRGTPVKATAAGRVLAVDDYFFNGKTVFVDHGNGLITMVCHLDWIDVAAGDPVVQGQPLGRSGMTGRASGPHVHWSVALNGAMVDPALFLTADASPSALKNSSTRRP